MNQPKAVLRGAIVLYFAISLEIPIMIRRAAGSFSAAFLLCAGQVYYQKFARKGVVPGGLCPRDRLGKSPCADILENPGRNPWRKFPLSGCFFRF